jgi:hypothetical protein
MWPFLHFRRRRQERIQQIIDALTVERSVRELNEITKLPLRSLNPLLRHLVRQELITGRYNPYPIDPTKNWQWRMRYRLNLPTMPDRPSNPTGGQ